MESWPSTKAPAVLCRAATSQGTVQNFKNSMPTQHIAGVFRHTPGEAMRELTRGEAEDQRGDEE